MPNLVAIGHIASQSEWRCGCACPQLRSCFVRTFSRAPRDDDNRPALRKTFGNCVADAARAAGDEHNLIMDGENVFHCVGRNQISRVFWTASGLYGWQ